MGVLGVSASLSAILAHEPTPPQKNENTPEFSIDPRFVMSGDGSDVGRGRGCVLSLPPPPPRPLPSVGDDAQGEGRVDSMSQSEEREVT